MVCTTSCAISTMFLVGMIYMTYSTNKSHTIEKYKEQLTPELTKTYDKIVQERTTIYYQGYILGFFLSLIILIYNRIIRKNKASTGSMLCIVIASSFVTNYFYYTLYPKSDYMLNHITTKEQTQAWLQMYNAMQNYYHMGLLLGIGAVIFLTLAFRC